MSHPLELQEQAKVVDEDVKVLHSLGYAQELVRRMKSFSNFAISFSIICILAGGITSFPQAFSAAGGASIGLGWPLACLLSLMTAVTMGQIASAFPTAGGLYHWASILGGKGWGWFTAWFNLAGLIAVLAAINVGTVNFVTGSLLPRFGYHPEAVSPGTAQLIFLGAVALVTVSQAVFNHLGIRVTTLLTDFSGYLILVVALILTGSLLYFAQSHDLTRLVTFTNYSGARGGGVWPETTSLIWLFALGFLHPGYTETGFDASANTAEETVGAAHIVPRGMMTSVLVSAIAGWVMVSAVVLAMPNIDEAARQGSNVFYWTLEHALPSGLAIGLFVGIAVANYLCGLATVTSVSRMVYAFSRDGGLPFSKALSSVSTRFRTPAVAIWSVAALMMAFTVYTPVYATITAVCVILLYISYTLPVFLGLFAYRRSWTAMGPWDLGRWYRPLGTVAVLWCVLLVVLGMQPPNDKAVWIVGGFTAFLTIMWLALERKRFQGPPRGVSTPQRQATIREAEKRIGQTTGELDPR